MFTWLMQKLRPKQINDPVFGHLQFIRMKNPSHSYWEGQGPFDPTKASIEYSICGDEAGPGASQYVIYRRIAENYPALLNLITPLLQREYAALNLDGVPTFGLVGLSLPIAEGDLMEWEVDFSCAAHDEWLFTVHMQGWQPTGEVSVSD